MSDYRARLVKAIDALNDMAGEEGSIYSNYEEANRLIAKAEGVKLALSYYDEMERNGQFSISQEASRRTDYEI